MEEKKYDEIKLILTLINGEKEVFKCDIKEKLSNMLNVYCRIRNIKLTSICLFYNGTKIDNYEKTIDELANKQSKSEKEVSILVYELEKSVIIVFSHSGDLYKEKIDIEKKINDVFSNYLEKKNIDKDKAILKFKGNIIEPYQTINQFITKNNVELKIDEQNEKLIEIKLEVIDIQKPMKIINFFYKKKQYEEYYELTTQMRDIFKKYAKKNKVNINSLEFKYKGISIKKNQSLEDFINNINSNDNSQYNNETQANVMAEQIGDNDNKINIEVIDLCFPYYYFKDPKILIFIILGILLIIAAVILVIFINKKDHKGESSISSRNEIIPNDYFINATYVSNEFETVKLISDEYDLSKIKNMSIDGNIIKPTKSYTFKKFGQHNIYYSFNYLSEQSLLSEGRGIFNGITKLIYIKVSNFSENYPDISFQGMFNNCINLQSADFSEMKLNRNSYFQLYTTEIYEYYNSMDYMFNNCTSLTSINFDFKKANNSNYLNIISSKFMFNNCISLTYLYLSKINFYKNLNNMFSNCILLETLILRDFNYKESGLNMSYMFYNCTSLASLVFPSQGMNLPNDMSYSFAYCSSLKKIDLEFGLFDYDDLSESKNTMSNIFRNCTSLVSVGLKFQFYYEDMSYAFMGCSSLESIETRYRHNYFFTKYFNGMFIDCYSLSDFYIIEDASYYVFLIDISYMFSGTSVRDINLSKFETKNITNYEGLFYDCKDLSSVDLSSFTHNDLPDSNLSIFKGNYLNHTKLAVNEEFLSRIQVPSNFDIIISENNNNF